MSIQDNLFTPYPEVNAVLGPLLDEVRTTLQDQFIGMYLFGSLTNGGFDRASDVDVLIVTHDELPIETFSALQAMHARIAALDSWCATQLEVSYIPREALRRYDPAHNLHPHLDRDPGEKLRLMMHGSDWIVQRSVLRERGITLAGPPPDTLIDPISAHGLREAMLPVLYDWLAMLIDNPAEIKSSGYQSYTVLTVCRVLYTLRSGKVLSKKAAADWAKETLDPRWARLIERAWHTRQSPDGAPNPGEVRQTLDFIRYALELHQIDEYRHS